MFVGNVSNGRVKRDVQSKLAQFLTEPLGVCVEPLPCGQLVSDGNNFGFQISISHYHDWLLARLPQMLTCIPNARAIEALANKA